MSIRLLTVLVFSMSAFAQPIDQKVEALLHQMTLDEKIGQLAQIGGISFGLDPVKPEERVRKGQAGSVLWLSDPVAINRMQRIAMEETRLHIPLLFGLDVIHGFRTIFPMPLALAASWDMPLIEKVQAVAAREARAAGIHWTFAPMVDIARDPRWGRMIEGAGEDPFVGAAVARAQVRGFQGDNTGQPDRLLACAKHFAAYGAADGGRDYDSAYVPEEQLWNVYLPPFKAAADAGVATFMSSYQDLNDVPGTGNAFLLQNVLRRAWNFRGFVVSDANSVKDLATHGFARDAADAGYRAFTAGVNMDMASGTYVTHLAEFVKQGRISVAAIDAAVRPILAAKYKLGLFERPYVDEAKLKTVVAAPEHRQLARVAAERSAVLLRNEGALLPLDPRAGKSIAVIGPLADSQRDVFTMWSGFDLDPSTGVTVADGIRRRLGAGAKVESAPGVEIRRKYNSMFETMMGRPPVEPWSETRNRDEFQKAVDLAKQADVVVMVLGELSTMDGEMASQSSIELPGDQQKLLEAVMAAGKPTVLVLINGRPLNIIWASTHVPAILEAWHPGVEGGNAVAALLFGDANPQGKLTISWPRDGGQIPLYYAHNRTHQPETDPQFQSRYWDQPSAPLYPFGYGLSYSRFAYSNLSFAKAEAKVGATIEVKVDVENTAKRAGDEIVQLYVHQRAGAASRPVRQLKGFERVTLAAGEKKTVRFQIGKDELSYWSGVSKKWVLEAESFDVWVGADSTASLHGEFRLLP